MPPINDETEEEAAIWDSLSATPTPTTIRVGLKDSPILDAAGVPPMVQQNFSDLGESVKSGLYAGASFGGDVLRESAESFIPDSLSSAAALTAMSAVPVAGELGLVGRGAMALGRGVIGATTKFATDALTREAQDIVGSGIDSSYDEPFSENLRDAAFDTVFGLGGIRSGAQNPAQMMPKPEKPAHAGLFLDPEDLSKNTDKAAAFDAGLKDQGKAIYKSNETYVRGEDGRLTPAPLFEAPNSYEGMAKQAESYSLYKTQQRDDLIDLVEANREGVMSPSSVQTVWTFKKPQEVEALGLPDPKQNKALPGQPQLPGQPLPENYFAKETDNSLSTMVQSAPEMTGSFQGIKEAVDFLEGTAQTVTTPTKRYSFGSVKGYQEAIQKLQGHIREIGGYDPSSPYSTFVKSLENRIRLYKKTLKTNIDDIVRTNLSSQTSDAGIAKLAAEAESRGLKPSDLYDEYNSAIHSAMGVKGGLYDAATLVSNSRANLGKMGGEASTLAQARSVVGGSGREDAQRMLTEFGSDRERQGVKFLYDKMYEPTIFERAGNSILQNVDLFRLNFRDAMKERFILNGVTKQAGIETAKVGIQVVMPSIAMAEELANKQTEELIQALSDPVQKKQALGMAIQLAPELFKPAPGNYRSYFDGKLNDPMEQEAYIRDVYDQDLPVSERAKKVGEMLSSGRFPKELPRAKPSPMFSTSLSDVSSAFDLSKSEDASFTDADKMVSKMDAAEAFRMAFEQ